VVLVPKPDRSGLGETALLAGLLGGSALLSRGAVAKPVVANGFPETDSVSCVRRGINVYISCWFIGESQRGARHSDCFEVIALAVHMQLKPNALVEFDRNFRILESGVAASLAT